MCAKLRSMAWSRIEQAVSTTCAVTLSGWQQPHDTVAAPTELKDQAAAQRTSLDFLSQLGE
jgi:hypothetical protein